MGAHLETAGAATTGASLGAAQALRLEGVSKHYGDKLALDRVTLSLPGDAYISLLGPSGSGKTVLLRLIAGFEEPDAGSIHLGGTRIDGIPAYRRGIGFVFQNFALFPHLDVYDNIAFGLANRSRDAVADAGTRHAKVSDIIELVGLTGLERRGVHQISGGQRQRVALARTLVTEPRLVLLDEPLGALDANLRARMRGELRRIRKRLGVTFLHVTGGETEALAMGDRVIVLDRGRVGQFDEPDAIYHAPANPNVARFLNCYNLFPGSLEDRAFRSAGGALPLPRRVITGGTGAAYAIRQDLIAIRAAERRAEPDEAALQASFVTSEYSGAAVTYFFRLGEAGQIVNVEHHRGHRPPEDLVPSRIYSLVWKAEDAVVYA